MHTKLTQAQAAAAQQLNRDLLALSRARRKFGHMLRAMSWPASHASELWDAYAAAEFPQLFTGA